MAPNTKIKKEIVVAEIAKQLWDNCQALDKYMTDNGIFYGLGSIDTSPNDQLWEEIVEKHLTAMIEELKEKLVVNVNDIQTDWDSICSFDVWLFSGYS